MRKTTILVVVGLLALLGFGAVTSYNSLNRLEQAVDGQWGQVENVYQRRADLVPNLVETVKGAANFERDTLTAVTEARSRVGQAAPAGKGVPTDSRALQNYEQAQNQLSSALSRLLVVSERYPELKATAAFRDLQVQLEGTENRITVERMRFNETAREFNTARTSFPVVLVAGLFGSRFAPKAYFQAQQGAATAPHVKF